MKCTRRKLEFFVVLVRGKKGSRFAPSRGLYTTTQRTIEESPFCSFFLDIPAMVGLTFHEDGLRPTFLAAQNLTDASASATN